MKPVLDTSAPRHGGRVHDAAAENWVDRFAPPSWRPYLRLARADRPIGTWLLLIPCWWGLALALLESDWRSEDLWLICAFAIGAFVMRGAGCIWNDITDRNIDGAVARTRSRPLPSGQVRLHQAVIWMCVLGLIGFLILLSLDRAALWCGVVALLPVGVYPFAKRFTWWPQFFLGIAFNWGVLMGWVAHNGTLGWPAVMLYAAGIAWTLHYDTIYAHQDREDDALIGVKSTARLFQESTKSWLCLFTALTGLFGAIAIAGAGGGAIAMAGLAGLLGHMLWQTRALDIDDPALCLRLFRATRWGGGVLLCGLVLDALI